MTSSIAGMATSGSSLPYCVTKAAQLQLMRVFAASQGPKVRCNAVCPGLLLTEWVSGCVFLFGIRLFGGRGVMMLICGCVGPEIPTERDQVPGGEGVLEESGKLDSSPSYVMGRCRKEVC